MFPLIVVTPYAVFGWISSALIASLIVVIFLGSTQHSARAFCFSMVWVMFLAICTSTLPTIRDPVFAAALLRFFYITADAIFLSFLYFTLVISENEKPPAFVSFGLIAIGGLLWYAHLFTDLLHGDPIFVGGIQFWGWRFGPLWFLFDVAFFSCFAASIIILLKKIFRTRRQNSLLGAKLFMSGIFLGLIPTATTNVVLPAFGFYGLSWVAPIPTVFWVGILGFAVIRYHQMDVKAVASEVFLILIAILLLANIFINLAEGMRGIIWRILLFAGFLVFAYFFLKSILKEAAQSDALHHLNMQLKDLTEHLQERVDKQTQKLRKAYEGEKKVRLELERLDEAKNQFIMLTQHHLRTPVTLVRWYLDALRENITLIPSQVAPLLKGMGISLDRINRLIDTFLDISQLQVGRNILRFMPTPLGPLMAHALEELKSDITQTQIEVHIKTPLAVWPTVSLDADKMREVFFNVIQNAVRYNTQGGFIEIDIGTRDASVVVAIRDSGVGVPKEEQEKIFTELFYRGVLARNRDTIGMGIGLSIARFLIEAHHGRIWLESVGVGKGSTVYIQLPFDPHPSTSGIAPPINNKEKK
ncbi:MAG: two-component system, OmpR family, sensor histidine kinase VicK [Parcubacteria group bacterium Gr01-1014_66]|nr:MAG: two-component system, OmpR family, sensor histidine kinase VicK [Parcubacteria group bacterium Gr01-1014_66]